MTIYSGMRLGAINNAFTRDKIYKAWQPDSPSEPRPMIALHTWPANHRERAPPPTPNSCGQGSSIPTLIVLASRLAHHLPPPATCYLPAQPSTAGHKWCAATGAWPGPALALHSAMEGWGRDCARGRSTPCVFLDKLCVLPATRRGSTLPVTLPPSPPLERMWREWRTVGPGREERRLVC